MPFGLHLPELIIVLVVALLIFGPKKLPEMGSAIGKSIKEFKKGINELNADKSTPKNPVEEISQPRFSEPVVASTVVSESAQPIVEKPLD